MVEYVLYNRVEYDTCNYYACNNEVATAHIMELI